MSTLTTLDSTASSNNDAILNELLEGLDDINLASEETIESDLSGEINEDSILESVVNDIALMETKEQVYADQAPDTVSDAIAPTKPAKGKKAKVAKEPKVKEPKLPKEAKAPEEPKEPAPPRMTKITHKPGDLLKAKLGAKAGDYLTFSMKDADLSVDEIIAKQEAFIARMNDNEAIADKVRDKIQMLLTWMATGGNLNVVLNRTLRQLHLDGHLTSGDKGNLHINLLEKPFSPGTARSQGNQMFMVLPELGITTKEKGRMVANPDSALLPIINSLLGL
jgi:hypothetical protein